MSTSSFPIFLKFKSTCQLYLWKPKDPSGLAVTRILFGILMAMDTLHERGFAEVDHRFGDPNMCHFPLFNFLKPLPYQWMCLLYLLMWLGALGITLGYHFKLSCLSFLLPYWYIFFLDKTAWNNHSYLYGLLSLILLFSSADNYWSLDSWLNPTMKNLAVPNWNYLILRFQIFLLYFYAGVKKMDSEWLGGYSMKGYGGHWVFTPFQFLLKEDDIEYLIVHLGGFLLDLTIGFWLLWPRSRPLAMFFGASFHVMNSQMFPIGMFPYVCLATLPVFCDEDWPKKSWISRAPKSLQRFLPSAESFKIPPLGVTSFLPTPKMLLMSIYVIIQLTLPWSHSVTQGYNNWTNGLYGYSWDMMVHAWDTMHVVVTVRHKSSGRLDYLDTEAFVRNDKWVGHADMVYQYAHCVRDRLAAVNVTDVAIQVDIWRSLNGRFQQRLVDPRVDLLEADWSPWRPTPWLMPLLVQLSPWRDELLKMERDLFDQEGHNASVLFVADFPGLSMENYVPAGVTNATLRVLEGEVELSISANSDEESEVTILTLGTNESAQLPIQVLYSVMTTSHQPACYMFIYHGLGSTTPSNNSSVNNSQSSTVTNGTEGTSSAVLLNSEVNWWSPLTKSVALVAQSFLSLVYGIPLVPTSTTSSSSSTDAK